MSVQAAILELELLRASWERGAPIRPNVLDRSVRHLLVLLTAADPVETAADALRAHALLARLAQTLKSAQTRTMKELTTLPARRRAVHAHACLQADAPSRLGVGA